jgi:hypothetical protein
LFNGSLIENIFEIPPPHDLIVLRRVQNRRTEAIEINFPFSFEQISFAAANELPVPEK